MGNVTSRSSGFIVLELDLFQQTVEVATGYILPGALAHKPLFKMQPVISCLGKEMMDAYVETNNNQTKTLDAVVCPCQASTCRRRVCHELVQANTPI